MTPCIHFIMRNLTSLTPLQKRSVFKIAVDLIKADNRIHCKEISVLDSLQEELFLSQDELDMIHYITVADAVQALRDMEVEKANEVLELFTSIMKVDSDTSFKENLLLTAVIMSCSKSSKDWAHIITSTKTEVKVCDHQIVFLEKEHSPETHKILDDKYDNLLISKAFADIGLQLFYLPTVLEDLGMIDGTDKVLSKRFGLLQKSMSYLMPSGNRSKIDNVEHILDSFDTTDFFKVVFTGLNMTPDHFPFTSFLLIKVRDSLVLDDRNNSKETIDFLCIDISTEVKKRILAFVSHFNEQSFMLPYEGYYQMLYDHLSSESKITSSIMVNTDLNFLLENLNNLKVSFESSPQSRTFYLLLLYYGRNGLRQDTINQAIDYLQGINNDKKYPDETFNINDVKQDLFVIGSDWSLLIYNTITIYQSVSNKDEQRSKYLSYICSILSHRSSLKTYVNKGFSDIEGLANPEQYHILFDREFNTYRVEAETSLFFCLRDGVRIPLNKSKLWEELI